MPGAECCCTEAACSYPISIFINPKASNYCRWFLLAIYLYIWQKMSGFQSIPCFSWFFSTWGGWFGLIIFQSWKQLNLGANLWKKMSVFHRIPCFSWFFSTWGSWFGLIIFQSWKQLNLGANLWIRLKLTALSQFHLGVWSGDQFKIVVWNLLRASYNLHDVSVTKNKDRWYHNLNYFFSFQIY